MKPNAHRTFAAITLLSTAVVFAPGCIAVSKVTYGRTLADVPVLANDGDKYCVIEIRDHSDEKRNIGQSAPPADRVMSRLAMRRPAWFSTGSDAVPVIVESLSSAPYVSRGAGWASVLSAPLFIFSLGGIPGMAMPTRIDYDIALEMPSNKRSKTVPFHAVVWGVMGWKPVVESIWAQCDGWKPYMVQDKAWMEPAVDFDGDGERKLDAFCAAIALAVQNLTPEEREAVRNNEEAWYLDAKLGNKRNRPVVVRPNPPGSSSDTLATEDRRPRIVSQSWDTSTRRGSLVLDLSGGEDRNAALAWARDAYLPEYCRTLGAAVSADDPSSAPPAQIRIRRTRILPDGTARIEFSVK